jgi:TetR/AcrR family transcriptional regulator
MEIIMDKFYALPKEKQNTIIEAALFTFGKLGYKKASAKEIATNAGISKGMIFHYFGSKKKLYLYLLETSFDTMYKAFLNSPYKEVTDFFDRIMLGTKIKLSVMKKHPSLFLFLGRTYSETDPEVVTEIKQFYSQGELFRNDFALTSLDTHKFKDSVDPNLVLQILVKFSEGYVGNTTLDENFDLDKMIDEFVACMNLMKNNFYKEEE